MWAGTTNGVIRFSGDAADLGPRRAARSPGPDVRIAVSRPDAARSGSAPPTASGGSTGGRLTHVALPGTPQMLGDGDRARPRAAASGWATASGCIHWDGARLRAASGRPDAADAHAHHASRAPTAAAGSGSVSPAAASAFSMHDRRAHTCWARRGADRRPRDHPRGLRGRGRDDLDRRQRRAEPIPQGRVATLDRANGLPAARVWAIVEDRQGRALAQRGPRPRARRPRRDRAGARRSPPTASATGSTTRSTAWRARRSASSARARAGDGTLWFVRGGGLTRGRPAARSTTSRRTPPPVRIEAVVADDRPPRRRRRDVACPPARRAAADQLHRADADLVEPHRFRYRLDGFDTDWVDAGTRRTAFYTNLSPGDYRFQVERQRRGRLVDDVSGGVELLGSAGVLPDAAGSRRWSAPAASLVRLGRLAGAAAPGAAQFSLALAERARLSREIHDTLLQSLVGVALQFDAIAERSTRPSSTAQAQLLRIRRAGRGATSARRASRSATCARRCSRRRDLATALRDFGKRSRQPTRASASCRRSTGTPRRVPPKIENAAAAHRPGGHHQRRAPRAGVAHRASSSASRTPPSRCASPTTAAASTSRARRRARRALRTDDDARARRGAGRPADASSRPRRRAPSVEADRADRADARSPKSRWRSDERPASASSAWTTIGSSAKGSR